MRKKLLLVLSAPSVILPFLGSIIAFYFGAIWLGFGLLLACVAMAVMQ